MFYLKVTRVDRLFHLGAIAFCIVLTLALAAYGQVSPEDHAKHHPGQGQEKKPAGGEMGGMMDMDKMMGGMMCGGPPPQVKELYPSLMDLPELSPEKREEIQRQAHERLQMGVSFLSQGLDRLLEAAPVNSYKDMQEAVSQMREGLAIFESGLAAHRALAEGKAPRNIVLQWFKHEMNLGLPARPEFQGGILGLSWFHFFIMVILIGFSATMIWMYFHKMRRATLLLQALTIGTPPGPALGKPEPVPPRPQIPPAEAGIQGKSTEVVLPTVTFSRSHRSAPLPSDKTILEVADDIGVEIDNSCRAGICGICKVKLLSGTVTMAVEDALKPEDKAQGIILACQATSKGNVVVEA